MNKNEQFVYDFFHTLWVDKDLSIIDKSFAENVLIESSVGLAIGTAGKKKITKVWTDAFNDLEINIDRVVSCGSKVSLRWSSYARHEGTFCGVSATGKYFNCFGACLFDIKDRLVVEYKAASTIGREFAEEGLKLKLPPKNINYAALVNAARYINCIRLEDREVEVMAMKISGMLDDNIAAAFKLSLQSVRALIDGVLQVLGVKEEEVLELLLYEGTASIFMKIAAVLKIAC